MDLMEKSTNFKFLLVAFAFFIIGSSALVHSQTTCNSLNITSIGCSNDPAGPQNCTCGLSNCSYQFYNGQTGQIEANIYNQLNEPLNITVNSSLVTIIPPFQNGWVEFQVTAPLNGQSNGFITGPEFDLYGHPYSNDSQTCLNSNLYTQYSYYQPSASFENQSETQATNLLIDAQTSLGSLQQVELIYENILADNNEITCTKASEQLSSAINQINLVDREFSASAQFYQDGNYILSIDHSNNALYDASYANQTFSTIDSYFNNCGIILPYIPPIKIIGPVPGQVTAKIYELPVTQNNRLTVIGQPFPLFILEMLSFLLIVSLGYFIYKNFGNSLNSSEKDE